MCAASSPGGWPPRLAWMLCVEQQDIAKNEPLLVPILYGIVGSLEEHTSAACSCVTSVSNLPELKRMHDMELVGREAVVAEMVVGTCSTSVTFASNGAHVAVVARYTQMKV